MTILTLNDTELFYQVVGLGLPCLVMHGGLGLDHTYLQPWLDPLGDRLQLIYYDQRGNGSSGRPPSETLTFDHLCRDAEALRADVGAERMMLLGHSLGGFVALEYALRYPERVSHLILVDSAPSFDYGEEIEANIQRKQPASKVLAAASAPAPSSDAEFGQMWRTVLPLYFHHYEVELAEAAFGQMIYSAAAATASGTLLAVYNVASRLTEIQVPTLVVAGDDDFICPPSQARRLQAGLPQAQLTILPDCGHFPFIECPVAFETALRSWLDQVT